MNPQEPAIDTDAIRDWLHASNRDQAQHWLEAVTHITALLAALVASNERIEALTAEMESFDLLKEHHARHHGTALTEHADEHAPPAKSNADTSKPVKYEIRDLVNSFGSFYGYEYVILESAVDDPVQWLIESVIGEAVYYASRGVWNQIVFTNRVQHVIDAQPANLVLGIDPASPAGDVSAVTVAHTDNGTLAFHEKMQSLNEMQCMFGSKPPTHHDLLAGDL